MSNQLIDQGLNLLVFGMGIVAVFLTLLVMATTIMSKVVLRFFPEPVSIADSALTSTAGGNLANSSNQPDARTLSIIKEAVRQHREKSQK